MKMILLEQLDSLLMLLSNLGLIYTGLNKTGFFYQAHSYLMPMEEYQGRIFMKAPIVLNIFLKCIFSWLGCFSITFVGVHFWKRVPTSLLPCWVVSNYSSNFFSFSGTTYWPFVSGPWENRHASLCIKVPSRIQQVILSDLFYLTSLVTVEFR